MAERPIEAELQPALDEAELAQVWRRVRDAQAERRVAPRRWRYAIATGVAIATAAVLLVAWPRGGRPAPGALGADVALAPGVQLDAPSARTVAMDDGSKVALAADAQLEVLANDGDKFVTAVRRGKVGFDVRPGGPRRWVIETDLATVEVVGTAFAVERSAVELAVTVERGVVLVRGERVPGRVVRLTAGQRIAVSATVAAAPAAPAPEDDQPPTVARAPSPPSRPAPAITTAPPASAITTTPPAPAITTTPPASAITAPASAITAPAPAITPPPPAPAITTAPPADITPPPPAPAITTAPPADIIARADELVAAGRAGRAADELTAYLADARADATAGLAAFLLGRLAQDQLGQAARAADAFARVRAIGSPRAIQEEALARQALALARAARPDDARAAARTYLAQYPDGARAGEMTALAGR